MPHFTVCSVGTVMVVRYGGSLELEAGAFVVGGEGMGDTI